jgi:aldose 1-epimerase
MPFEIKKYGDGAETVVQLKDDTGNCTVEIFCFGAILNKFTVLHEGKELNVIDGFENVHEAHETMAPAFKSAKLSPFVCRINEAKYKIDEKTYELSKYSMGKNAIHGLVYDAAFTIVETSADDTGASVKLSYQYDNPSQGYPFKFTCEVLYELSAGNSLSITTTIKNTDEKEIPVADGWHPYFTLGDTINNYEFQLKSSEMLEFDSELIPTGKLVPYKEFETLKTFGPTWFDNCFTVDFNAGEPLCILRNPKRKIEVQIYPSVSYPYIQFYTPDHRQSIAIENLSAAPDAFNNRMGLQILQPFSSASFNTKFVIKQL